MHQGHNIQVFVRCRPMKQSEKRSCVEVLQSKNEIKVLDRNSSSAHDTKNFYFDRVFAPDTKQTDVYKTVVKPLIDQVLVGFNCTVFAYGQTGTGKTYTMEGERSDQEMTWEEDPHSGIIPRSISQLFDTLKDHDSEFTVRVSFLELYNEDTYDLLSAIDDTTKLKIFDDAQKRGSVIVGGLEEIIVQSKAEIFEILRRGSAKRQTAATLLNACSSRSHTIFSVTVHIREGSIEGDELLKIGKLNLVDLAGSENIGRSGAQDKRAREAGSINQSLLTLGRVITALVEKRPHIPYRESKLTRLLQDSLGGKTKTSIIATISPSSIDLEDTLNTLDYASRAKKITNKPEMNQRLTKKALLKEYTNEIERLRRDLQATREKNGVYIDEENYKEMCNQLSAGNDAIKEKEDRLAVLQEENEKKRKLFEDFTSQYEQTKAELNKAKEDCERKNKLIENQKKTQEKLTDQAEKLMDLAKVASTDNMLLHSKRERIENLLKENRDKASSYFLNTKEDMTRLASVIELNTKELAAVPENLKAKVAESVNSMNKNLDDYRASIRSQVTEFIDRASEYNNLASLLSGRRESYKKQAEHYESLAAECRTLHEQTDSEITKYIQLANNMTNHARMLNDGTDPELTRISNYIQSIKLDLEKSEQSLRMVMSTQSLTIKREISSTLQRVERLTRDIKDDVKTGMTPQKKTYDLPKRLIRPSEDSILECDDNSTYLDDDQDNEKQHQMHGGDTGGDEFSNGVK